MSRTAQVMEYKCPCCNAGLIFGEDVQQLTCEYCNNTFELNAVKAFQDSQQEVQETFHWEETTTENWSESEQNAMQYFQCPSCGGEILSDENTAATFCPYCGNPTILPGRVSEGLKPDGVIPFQTSKEDAKAAFLKFCKGKPLLPKIFTKTQTVEKITGMYVPFWLFDCSGSLNGSYRATRVHRWSDKNYNYTRTEHYLLNRSANAEFLSIPMDGSSKLDDTTMEAIEPYDYSQVKDFDMAYLSGFLADKYDVESKSGENRIRSRVNHSLEDMVSTSMLGYSSVIPTRMQVDVTHSKVRYVLMPVWILNTKYRDKIYTFAMNGQTGKLVGKLPICPKQTAKWFLGLTALFSIISVMMIAMA